MKRRVANLISLIFHPVIFAFLIPFIIVYKQTANFNYGIEWMLFTSIFVFAAIMLLFFLRPVDVMTDFDLSSRTKRPIFYAIALLFSVLYFIIAIIFKGIFFPLSIVGLGIILGIVIFELVNFYIKASIHAGVICAYVITFGLLFGFVPALALAWIPFVVGWARIYLHKHTRTEFITGGAIGSMVTFATFAIERILMYNK